MGLDVYVYHYDDFEKSEKLEKEYNAESEKVWERGLAGLTYSQLSPEAQASLNSEIKELGVRYGLNEGGVNAPKELNLPSVRYPDHYFKIGYFRSSYNEGGINSVMSNKIGKTLYDLGIPEGEVYTFVPDWKLWLENAKQMRADLHYWMNDNGNLNVMTVRSSPWGDKSPNNTKEAMEIFLAEKARSGDHFDSYSNANGEFFLDKPLLVRGLMFGRSALGGKCVYVITDNSGDTESYWYLQALEIVVETCEYVLAQPDPHKYVVHWSA